MSSPAIAARSSAPDPGTELQRILQTDGVVSVYQPIVDLATGSTVAYEALARGPKDSPLHTPGAMFGATHREGLLVELDLACRAAALRGAIGTGLQRPTALFVNVEPVASAAEIPEQFAELVAEAARTLRVVFEFTERALTERPGDVLQAVRALRELGAEIALDDVGVDPRSLALMPFLRPEVIKLDMSIVQGPMCAEQARTVHAVRAHAELFGALVLAEGIETEEHLERALGLGASYGQGWLFGRPAPAPKLRVIDRALPRRRRPPVTDPSVQQGRGTPYERVRDAGGSAQVASKRLLLSLSRQLELQALDLGPECVVLSSLQRAVHFTALTKARYEQLADRVAFAGVLGEGIEAEPAAGVRGGKLDPSEPLMQEWSVCVISPHFAAAMVAIDLGDEGPDMDRRFEYRLTYDRRTAVRAAVPLMSRIAAVDGAAGG